MEAIKTKGVAHKGVLTVHVPKEFEDKELEVIVLSAAETQSEINGGEEKNRHDEKVKRLMGIVGAAKFPDLPITKCDVYEQ